MKTTLLTIAAVLGVAHAKAQLNDGSLAPELNVEVSAIQFDLYTAGLNGNGTYSLYDYLDAGYTVFLDFSTTWCSPCWEYHESGALEELYREHGPLLPGHPGVNPNSTNDVMVIWIEMDPSTDSGDLLDGSGYIGNWMDPTGNDPIMYPIADPQWPGQINYDFNIASYPSVYMVCPNRVMSNVWSSDPDFLYEKVQTCPVRQGTLNPDLQDGTCAQHGTVTLHNLGSENLTQATLQLKRDGSVINTVNWSGDLPTYGYETVFSGLSQSGDYEVQIVSQDEFPVGNDNSLQLKPVWSTPSVTVEITTDAYGNETHWHIAEWKTPSSIYTPLATGGDYAQVPVPGTAVQTPVTVQLEPNTCYVFVVRDDFGDGMSTTYGEGSFRLKDAAGNIMFEGGDFTDHVGYSFQTTEFLGIGEIQLSDLLVWPNPSHGTVSVSFTAATADYLIEVIDLQGRIVRSFRYAQLSGEQTIALPLDEVSPGNYLLSIGAGSSRTVRQIVLAD
jgi:hypothetical protein